MSRKTTAICDQRNHCLARQNAWSEEEQLLEGVSADLKDELVRQRIEKLRTDNELASLKVQERRDELVDAAEVHEELMRKAEVLREVLHELQRQYGTDALNIVFEAMDEIGI